MLSHLSHPASTKGRQKNFRFGSKHKFFLGEVGINNLKKANFTSIQTKCQNLIFDDQIHVTIFE